VECLHHDRPGRLDVSPRVNMRFITSDTRDISVPRGDSNCIALDGLREIAIPLVHERSDGLVVQESRPGLHDIPPQFLAQRQRSPE
jgi:hypothetical protein